MFLIDSLSTLQKLKYDRDDEQFRNLKRELAMLTARSRTVLQWMPARVGLLVNEQADQMAKAANHRPANPFPSERPRLLPNRFTSDWTTLNRGFQPNQDALRQLDKTTHGHMPLEDTTLVVWEHT